MVSSAQCCWKSLHMNLFWGFTKYIPDDDDNCLVYNWINAEDKSTSKTKPHHGEVVNQRNPSTARDLHNINKQQCIYILHTTSSFQNRIKITSPKLNISFLWSLLLAHRLILMLYVYQTLLVGFLGRPWFFVCYLCLAPTSNILG